MLWRVVASYLAFVIAVGPGLCCCTTTPVAALTAAGLGAHPDRRTPPPPSCCCPDLCSTKADPGSEPGRAGAGDQDGHKPGKHQCPCKDKGGKQTLDQTAPSSQTAQDLSRLLTAVLQYIVVAFVADPAVDSGLDSGGGSSPPGQRLTSWRLLNAPHMLRC